MFHLKPMNAMGKIFLEAYVESCVNALKGKYFEEDVVDYVKYLKKHCANEYDKLSVRAVYDVVRPIYEPWKWFSDEVWDKCNDSHIYSLFSKAFRVAFPKAWETIKELE